MGADLTGLHPLSGLRSGRPWEPVSQFTTKTRRHQVWRLVGGIEPSGGKSGWSLCSGTSGLHRRDRRAFYDSSAFSARPAV